MKEFSLTKNKMTFRNKVSLFIFELFFKSAFYVTAILLFQSLLKITLRFSKFSYLTLENIKAYLRSPVTITCLICLLFIVGIFLLNEIVSLIIFYYTSTKKKNINVEQILFPGIKRTREMFFKKASIILMPFFVIIESLFLTLPLILFSITRFRIPGYVLKSIFGKKLLMQTVFTVIAVVIILGYFGMFVLQYCSLEGKGFFEAFKISIRLQKGHNIKIIKILLKRNLILLIIFFAVYYIALSLTGYIIYSFVDGQVIIAVYLNAFDKINVISAVISIMAALISNTSVITKLFIYFREHAHLNEQEEMHSYGNDIEMMQKEVTIELEVSKVYPKSKIPVIQIGKYRTLTRMLFLCITIFSFIYIFNWIRHGTFTSQQVLFGIKVSAHRGSSKDAPENTLPAIEKAIADYADYAEIDVQATKDGVVVLLHDYSVSRTTNGTGYIWDYTYYDLMKLDAGSWFSKEFAGTRIPTLGEILEVTKGKIFLNIEIKKNNHNSDIAERVVKIIEEYDFEHQCVVTSSHYASLAKVKELNPDIKTGYIMALAYGNFLENEYADFFSIKSAFINENLVKLANSIGKEVHAWTVNSKNEMERMKNLGVNNIITDYPLIAKEVIYSEEKESLMGFLRLFIN